MRNKKPVLAAIYASIDCPCGVRHISMKVNPDLFSGSSADCDMCGSHSSTEFYYTCPVSNKGYTVEVTST